MKVPNYIFIKFCSWFSLSALEPGQDYRNFFKLTFKLAYSFRFELRFSNLGTDLLNQSI